ncbi:MAG: lipopolysaccharide biosynthesis protein [Nitrosomonas sp.]|nr:lipopolysaccharide biosynthesis protein [Nitrosomonas sp.]
MATLRKSLLINFAQNYGIIVIQFTASIILARLLSPAEIGIFSVAATLIALAQAVRDFGVGQYIVQEKELNAERIRSAFTVTLIVAVILAAITASLCTVAADFYREPGVRNVMLVLALNFLLIPFGQITLGYLQREMKFGAIAQVKIGSTIVHFAVSISLAYMGFSYMSLAYASLANVLSSAVIANLHRPKDMPWSLGFGEVRRVLSFGSFSVMTNIAGALAKGVSDLVVGRMINMASVGLFSRASGLIEIFNQGVMNALWAVALPHFSKAAREGGDIRSDFLQSACLITGLAWPFFCVLTLLAEPMVLLLYGQTWIDCIPLVKWICLAFWIIAPFYLFSSVLLAIGQVRKMMWIEISSLPIQFGIYIVGALSGNLEEVAMANVVYALVKGSAIYFVLQHHLNFGYKQFSAALWRSFSVMVFTATVCAIAMLLMPKNIDNNLIKLILGGVGAIIGWLIGVFLLKHPLSFEVKNLFVRVFNSKNK